MVKKGSGWHGESRRHAEAVKKGLGTRYGRPKTTTKRALKKQPIKTKRRSDIETAKKLQEWGGGFNEKLSKTFLLGNKTQKAKIKANFPELWQCHDGTPYEERKTFKNPKPITGRESTEIGLRMSRMNMWGGDAFTHQLGETLWRADGDNTAKIKKAFPELWKKYSLKRS